MCKEYSEKQLNALKSLIFRSKDAQEKTKKACFAMIDASCGFTKPVYYTGQSNDISGGVRGMINPGGSTHINTILYLLETNFVFSHHGGHFHEGKFEAGGSGHTIWLSSISFDEKAMEITKEQVEKIVLVDPLVKLKKI